MDDLEELIRYELEGTRIDFKRSQYSRDMHAALLKDCIALANAGVDGDRYIICGVGVNQDGTRDFNSIREHEFVDAAIYQQLVRENIDPDFDLEYRPFRIDGHLLGVMRIKNCVDPPYVMRKKFGDRLEQGDVFIRKGSHNTRAGRQDLDRIYKRRTEAFVGPIHIGFDADGSPVERVVPRIDMTAVPSCAAAAEIRSILACRHSASSDPLRSAMLKLSIDTSGLASALGQPKPYEQCTSEELRGHLSTVAQDYIDEDRYHLFEKVGTKLNLLLLNNGSRYLEDAVLKVRIPKDRLLVADRVHPKPLNRTSYGAFLPDLSMAGVRYPDVEEHSDYFEVTGEIGDLRHGIRTRAFAEPIRVAPVGRESGSTIELVGLLFGKQLAEPLRSELLLTVL
jgi:hypothetical protein